MKRRIAWCKTKKKLLVSGLILVLLLNYSMLTVGESQKLRVAFFSQAVPYSFVGNNGTNSGFLIDLTAWLAQQSGYKVEFVPYDTHSACRMALLAGEVDAIIGNKTQLGDETLFQSLDPLASTSLCLVALSNQAREIEREKDFSSCRAVYEYGTVLPFFLYSLRARQYISSSVQEDMLIELRNGRAEIAIMDYESCMYFMQQPAYREGYSILRRDMGTVDYSLFFNKENQYLRNQLSRAIIDAQTQGVYEQIADRWLANNYKETQIKLRRLWAFLGIIAASAFTVIGLITWMNRLLRNKVAKKTAELETANKLLDEKILALESDSRLRRSILENSPNGMVAFDAEEKVTLINQAALHLQGVSAVPEGCRIHDLSLWSQLLEKLSKPEYSLSADSPEQPHIISLDVDGQQRKYRCALIRGTDDPAGERILSAEDITDEEQEKQRLFEQEKNLYLNRFVAGIAHEIKNPLMSIRMAASMLRDNPSDHEVQEAAAFFVPDEVDRINQLVEGLVQYAKPVKGEKSVFEVRPLVEECLFLINMATKKMPILYSTNLEEGLFVQAHRDRLKQSLLNIIMNSLESMEERLKQQPDKSLLLSILAFAEEEHVVILVRDEGMGMNEQTVRDCLNPFYTTKQHGTGLGLTLVRQYLDENGGKLSIDSREGEYTQIKIQMRRIANGEA